MAAAATGGGPRQRPWPCGAAAAGALVTLLLLLLQAPGGVRGYPHYLLNPEGCKTKKLEVGGGVLYGGLGELGLVAWRC
jgi:hypothetical protein